MIADGSRHLLVVTPGDRELDLRLVAQAVGAKSAHMALQRDAERLTGLKVGGISPLALLDKRFEVYVDAPAAQLDELYINGGQRGVNLRLRVSDLLAVTGAQVIMATHDDQEEQRMITRYPALYRDVHGEESDGDRERRQDVANGRARRCIHWNNVRRLRANNRPG